MIKEIKKKKNKFGAIITRLQTAEGNKALADNIESMNQHAALVTIFTNDKSHEAGNGISWVGSKNTVKLKNAIGQYLIRIRGDELVAFLQPDVVLKSDASKVYEFADANRMERAYGFFVGDKIRPAVVALNSSVMEHLFHSIPDNMDMNGDWVGFIGQWAEKTLMKHRYFDASSMIEHGSLIHEQVKPQTLAETILATFKGKKK